MCENLKILSCHYWTQFSKKASNFEKKNSEKENSNRKICDTRALGTYLPPIEYAYARYEDVKTNLWREKRAYERKLQCLYLLSIKRLLGNDSSDSFSSSTDCSFLAMSKQKKKKSVSMCRELEEKKKAVITKAQPRMYK